MNPQNLKAEIDAKKFLLGEFETSTPANRAFWKAWDMAESIAKRQNDIKRPTCRADVVNLLKQNIEWLEQKLANHPTH